MATDTAAQQVSFIEDVYSLSALQETMVTCAPSTAKPGQDLEQVVGELREDIEIGLFTAAWDKVFQRHAALRTGFSWADLPRPQQQVQRRINVPVTRIDWCGLSSAEQEHAFKEWLQADRLQDFDLTRPPLSRATLFKLDQERFRFVWTFHHALLDATAFAIVLEELFALYDAAVAGKDVELPPAPAYREFIEWANDKESAEAEAFWKNLLCGFEIPTSFGECGAVPSALTRFGEQTLELSRHDTELVRTAAERLEVTTGTLLHAAWGLLLARYSCAEDIVFGSVRAGRRGMGRSAERMVGLLINTLPFRVKCPIEQPVTEWLQSIRRQQVAARPFEHTPLLRILEWSPVQKETALFETILNFQEPAWHDRLRSLSPRWNNREFRVHNQPGYPLWLDAWAGETLSLRIGYERERFDDQRITRMLAHLSVALRSLANSQPGARVGSLEVMSETETRQVIYDWNRTSIDFTNQRCVQDMVAEQAARTPAALAAASTAGTLNYKELNTAANQLAHYLKTLGAGSETRIAVCMDRSLEMVIAVLAILKAGSAYVPLDPSYPKERLDFMLADSGALAVLTRRGTGPIWDEATAPKPVIEIDRARPGEWGRQPSHNPSHRCGLNNLAYVIYTSGSSGRPKGVGVEHRGLMNLVGWHQRSYQLTTQDRATLLAGPAFDASVWELWPYLAAGASVHVPDEEIRLAPRRLLSWLDAQSITLTFLPTPMAEALLSEEWPENRTLRAVLTGGERLHRRPGPRFGRTLINHYGPTECSVVATAGVVAPADTIAKAPSIGRPIANTRAYCLDPWLRPLPIGVTGELHLSGAGLARGYLNQVRLTAEKFIANPFAEAGHDRLYKTGDLVRWQADGTLEFVGRCDQQIKIRGQRVELGEIEAILSEHPGVREVAVKGHAGKEGNVRLVAYVVKTAGSSVEAGELKASLARKLPQQMRPDTLIFLPALPVTPNGKVDRAALQPADERTEPGFEAPTMPIEEMLAGIWCAVLDRPQVGIHDNFFELGGHSLQATQVMSRLRSAFNVSLPLHFLFDAPTVAGLAGKIHAAQARAQENAPILQAGEPGGAPAVSFAQERMWFLEQLEPGLPLHNVPFALQLRGSLDAGALEASLCEIVRRHKTLRTVFSSRDGQLVPREEPPGVVRLQVTDLSGLNQRKREEEARRIMLEQSRAPFDLSQGPLLRACLVRLAETEHLLVLTMHLIASDAWSVGIFYKELAALYEALSTGHPSPLQPLPIDYTDFARWQRRCLTGERLQDQIAYWRKQWAEGFPVLSLPTDFPRAAVQTFNGATRFFALPATLAQALRSVSRREDATLFMLLLAAFNALLQHYSGSDVIVIGSPIAGRTRTKTEDLIGAFVNTLALRTDLRGDPDFTELLSRVRATCLGAYHNQDLPLEKLVDALQPPRDPSRHPLFQVMFTFQNAPLRPLELIGLELKPLPVDSGVAKFDLTLLLEESGQGLSGGAEYNTDLFEPGTITQLLANFQTLLERIAENPRRRLSALTAGLSARGKVRPPASGPGSRDLRQPSKKQKPMQIESPINKPGRIRRKAVRMEGGEIVRISPLAAERPGPMLLEAQVEGVDLPEWARSNKARVDQLLTDHRALVFRNFGVKSVEQFQQCVLATCNGELLNYVDRSTPRPSVGNKVYVSTIYPSAETIQMHNEGTYWRTWPLKIYFCSLITAEQGGETPIADVRNVLRRLSPEIQAAFREKQVMYVRNYNDGFGLPWQETFQTQEKTEVEAYCRTNDIQFEWKEGDRLRTRQIRPAIRKHPVTGELVWFNHAAFFHVSSLAPQVRAELLAAFGEEELPYNTYYGDGSPIEPEAAAAVREAYEKEKLIFPWQNGDVMLLDNMSMAHGRQPYKGRREVVVSMAEPCCAG